MVKKFVLAVLLLSSLLAIVFDVRYNVSVAVGPSIIRVPEDYSTIQEAVDAANSGDIVLVAAGTYYEHVKVNKTVSLVGWSQETTIIDGNGIECIYVTADNVKISGFTIQNGRRGIVLNQSSGNIVYGNTVTSNEFIGVDLEESSGNIISNNQIMNNEGGVPGLWYGTGIGLGNSNSNIVSDNLVSNHVAGGISVFLSYDNIVANNTCKNNGEGIGLRYSAGNIVSDNIVASSNGGIVMGDDSTKNTVVHNTVFENVGSGIGVNYFCSMNVVKENNITENGNGINIAHFSPNNTFVGNTISKNGYGINIHLSNGSIIHHNNFINNTRNAPEDVYPNVNTWHDGYPSGGNYWSDYNGADLYNGPHQNLTGSDGISDTPNTLFTQNEDKFPLIHPISFFKAGTWNGTTCDVHVVSNSTISNFHLNKTQRKISFNVTGFDYTLGFCRVTIPNIIIQDLWQNNYTVLVDGKQPLTTNNWTDSTYTYMYLTYLHSEHEVVIIPEFPLATILPLFMIITLCALILTKKIKP